MKLDIKRDKSDRNFRPKEINWDLERLIQS